MCNIPLKVGKEVIHTLYMKLKNPHTHTQKRELINELSKIKGYKINIQQSAIFYTLAINNLTRKLRK